MQKSRTTEKFDESFVKVRLSEEKEDVVFFKDWNTFELQNSSYENIWVLIKQLQPENVL